MDQGSDLRRSVPSNPGAPAVALESAHALLAQGKPIAAVEVLRAVADPPPQNAGFHYALADLYLKLGSTFDAVESLREGLRIAPRPEMLGKLVTLEFQLGWPDQAVEHARKLLLNEPDNASAHLYAGLSLVELRRLNESEAHWLAAMRGSPKPWIVERQRAFALATIGESRESRACLERSIVAQPSQGVAYQVLFQGQKARESDRSLVMEMERMAELGELEPDEAAALEFALGKVWDDLDDPELAMRHFDRGNEIRRAMYAFDRQELVNRCGRHRALFPSQVPRTEEPIADKPIFVVGMMRSGTTLIEQILASHSQVAGAGEIDFWPGSEHFMIDMQRRCIRGDLVSERRNAYLRLLNSFGGQDLRVVDKNPANIMHAGMLNSIFPNAPIIHVRRNPVDVAISMWLTDAGAPFMWDKGDIVFAIKQTLLQADYWRQALPSNRFLDLRYEDVVTNTDSTVRALFRFCGLPWEESCLSPEQVQRKVNTPSMWQVRQPINRSSVERWKRYEPWLGSFRELIDWAP